MVSQKLLHRLLNDPRERHVVACRNDSSAAFCEAAIETDSLVFFNFRFGISSPSVTGA